MESLNGNAAVTHRGAILLGNYVACDAFHENKPLRVVTHAHADHMVGLKTSLKRCEKVLMTKATKDLIYALKGPLALMGGLVETLDYGETMRWADDRVTFFRADHILGASQVLVENDSGERIVYTGDFKVGNTPVLKSDLLVLEATYGKPSFRRSFEVDVKELIVSMVQEGLEEGTVYIFGYYGKLQEVMQLLRKADVEVPFVMPKRVFHVSEVYENHGMRLGKIMFSMEAEAIELITNNQPCVAFHHMNSRKHIHANSLRICVSGWQFTSPCRQISDNEYILALSDHSDFEGLIDYVRCSKPKRVITDNYRVAHGEILASEITKRLGIPAVALPSSNHG